MTEFGIDFDAASAAWMANKIRKGEAVHYRCTAIQKNGTQCRLAAPNELVDEHLCKAHRKKQTPVKQKKIQAKPLIAKTLPTTRSKGALSASSE